MQPFKRAHLPTPTDQQITGWTEFARTNDFTSEDMRSSIQDMYENCEVWLNDIYQVYVRRFDELVHLSIKRIDKEPGRDWRHFQAIKNELVGPECEAVELYPAESRLVDTANQYHLWVVTIENFRFPFGFTERLVDDNNYGDGSKQRAFATD